MKISFKLKVWIGVAVVSAAIWGVFLASLLTDPPPVAEQLQAFGVEADTQDIWHRAVLFHGIGDYGESAKLYEQAIERNPDSTMFHLYRGKLLFDVKDYDGAIAKYEDALELDPEFAWAVNARAVARYFNGDQEGCLRDLELAAEMDPDFTGPKVNMGVLKRLDGDTDGALKIFLDLREQSGPRVPGHFLLDNIAKIYFDTGNYPASIEALTVIITHYPVHIDAYKKRAQVYRRMNRLQEAQADSDRFMELSTQLGAYARDLKPSG